MVSQVFVINGWAIDLAAPGGSGTNAVHAWAYPVAGGNPLFAGGSPTGLYRSDLAAAFGEARFGHGGFSLWGSLPPGEYNLYVFASSTIRGFNNHVVIRIRVV